MTDGAVVAAPGVTTVVVAPEVASCATAVGYGAVVFAITAIFLPKSADADSPDTRSFPVIAESSAAASATVWPMAPIESCEVATGSTPSWLTVPTVGLIATTPALPAGAISCAVWFEVSRPPESGARPAETAAEEPAEEPPRLLLVSDGSSAWPPRDE